MAITQNLKLRHRSGADVARHIYQAEIKSSLLDHDIKNIVNVISDALKKAEYNSGMGKSLKKNEIKTKTTTAQTMVWRVLWDI